MDSRSNSIMKEYKSFIYNHISSTSEDSSIISNSLNSISTQDLNNRESQQTDEVNLFVSQKSNNLHSIFEASKKENVIKEKKYIIMCKECYFFPQIIFDGSNKLNIKCNCKEITDMDYEYFIKEYIIKNKSQNQLYSKIIIENYCFCERHNKPYTYFCWSCNKKFDKICGVNLCDDCVRDTILHSNHIIKQFDNEMFENIKKINSYIKREKNIKIESNTSIEESYYDPNNDNKENFLLILKMILICSKNYFCYNIHTTIAEAIKFINNKFKSVFNCINNINNNINKNKIIISIIKKNELININDKNRLSTYLKTNNYKDEAQKIKSIELQKSNFYNINIFINYGFEKLEILSLVNNNISNIEPLLKIRAPNLKKLSLKSNKITDEYIYVIKEMNFPKLNSLILESNYFHDFELFNCFSKYEYLDLVYFGFNKFIKNYDKYKDIKIEMKNIKEIGLTRGVFSDKTIKILSNFNFMYLQQLYISLNNLSSLDFVNNLTCLRLKVFWGYSNKFKKFFPLTRFKELEKINLSKNLISDISKLPEFIEKLEKLSIFDLSGNKIEKNKENLDIIKKIKNSKRKDIKLLI